MSEASTRSQVAEALDRAALAEDVMPLPHLVLRGARRDPEHEALLFPDTRWSYRELAERSGEVARGLLALGVGPQDHVGVLMTNHPDIVACFFGVMMTGAVVVPINARYRAAEIAHLVDDADLVAIITHDSADDHVDFAALLHDALDGLAAAPDPYALALPDYPLLRYVAMMGAKEPAGMIGRAAFLGHRAGDAEVDRQLTTRVAGLLLRDPALILYTSGTTSAPRGAILTHEAFCRIWGASGRLFGTTPADRHWCGLPLFHVAGLGAMISVLTQGATFLSDYSWDPGRTLEVMERERVTEFYPAYQPIMEAFLAHPRFPETDLSALRWFNNTAQPEILAAFQEALPHAAGVTMYGGTEGGPVTVTAPGDPLEERINTSGKPQVGIELRITDEDGNELPIGEEGIIQFRGYNTLSGYYKAPEKTAETMLPGGWVTMMDLGRLDEHGNVLFLGRAKETLKVGGENVAPQEVEAQLCTHAAVRLAQVVGIPDERLVEVPAAYVELHDGAAATEEELIDYLRGRIASFKVPRLIRFIERAEDWPMSATKIQRFRLRERLMAELGQTPATDEG